MDPDKMTKAALLQAYHDCKTQADKDALYWSSSVLQGFYSAANHGPAPKLAGDDAGAPGPNAS